MSEDTLTIKSFDPDKIKSDKPVSDLILTIDGPGGAGKSAVSRKIAERLGFTYLDTGAMYRAVALAVDNNNISVEDESAVCALCQHIDLQLEKNSIFLNKEDVTHLLRTPKMDMLASDVSRLECVRSFLGDLQRQIGTRGKIVAEGRDMGTVIFPNALAKIFLTATPEVRAKRRYDQLSRKGVDANYNDLLAQLIRRDEADSNRLIAPLRPAEDALVVDSTDLTLDEVVNKIIKFAIKKFM